MSQEQDEYLLDHALLQLSRMDRRDVALALGRIIARGEAKGLERVLPKYKSFPANHPDYSQMPCAKIAFKIAYDGAAFSGLAF